MSGATTRTGRARLGASAALLTTAVVLFTAGQASSAAAITAVINGLVVAVPLVVALTVLDSHPGDRFSRLLLVAGFAFSLIALAQAHDPLLYSIGRLSVWFVVPGLQVLLLAFPSGRLSGARDRALVLGSVVVAALYLPTALLEAGFPTPSPWTTCGTHCPPNALNVADLDLGPLRAVRETLTVLVMAAVALSLVARVRRAGPLGRRALAPVLGVALIQVGIFGVYLWARAHGGVSADLTALARVYLLSVPLVALGFAAGLVLRRIHAADVLQDLALRLRPPATPQGLRAQLADALEDPSLEVLDGDASTAAAPTTDRLVTAAAAGDHRIAVVHDARLGQDPRLVEAAATYGAVVLENTRLVEDLRASRHRESSAAGDERRKIERDLHDGAQQQLLALRIRLSLLAEDLRPEVGERATELEAIGDGIDEAVDVVRSLAHGVPPRTLAVHGLPAALRLAAIDTVLPVLVREQQVGRYSDAIEAAVYFSCAEALQNAVKHAHGATGATVTLVDDGVLRFEVSDDGPGFDAARIRLDGGLRNIGERLAAVGGTLAIDAAPGRGTRISGIVPTAINGGAPVQTTGVHPCDAESAQR